MKQQLFLPAELETFRKEAESVRGQLLEFDPKYYADWSAEQQVVDGVQFLDYMPNTDEYDPRSAVVIIATNGNGNGPHTGYRNEAIRRLMGQERRVIAFPDSTNRPAVYWKNQHVARAYHLDEKTRAEVAEGNFDAISDQRIRLLESLGIEHADFVGLSMGGTLAHEQARRMVSLGTIAVGNLALIDPPSVVNRTEEVLAKDFSAAIGTYFKAVSGNGVPNFSLVKNGRSLLRDAVPQLAGNLQHFFDKDQDMKANTAAVIRGLGKATLVEDLRTLFLATKYPNALLAHGSKSAITPSGDVQSAKQELSEFKSRFRTLELSGLDHNIVNNLYAVGLVARLALANSDSSIRQHDS